MANSRHTVGQPLKISCLPFANNPFPRRLQGRRLSNCGSISPLAAQIFTIRCDPAKLFLVSPTTLTFRGLGWHANYAISQRLPQIANYLCYLGYNRQGTHTIQGTGDSRPSRNIIVFRKGHSRTWARNALSQILLCLGRPYKTGTSNFLYNVISDLSDFANPAGV